MDRSSLVITDDFLRECRTGWLLVEDNFGGRLNEKEKLKYALQCTGRNPSQRSIDKYWTQNGGSITFIQFCGIMRREHSPTLNDLVTLFKKIDKNKDGLISANDLIKLLTKRGEPMTGNEAQGIIDGLDLNDDKQLDYMEFCQSVIETTEDCLRAARLKVQEKEEELEDNKKNRNRKRKDHTRRKNSSDKEREERKRETKRQPSYEEGREQSVRMDTKMKAIPPPAVIYPTVAATERHSSPEEDMSSDLPTVTLTSTDAISPLSSIDVPEMSSIKSSSLPISKDGGLPPLSLGKKTELPQQHNNNNGSGEEEQLKGSKDIEIVESDNSNGIKNTSQVSVNSAEHGIVQKGSEDIDTEGDTVKGSEDVTNERDTVKGSEDVNNNEESSVAEEIDEEIEEVLEDNETSSVSNSNGVTIDNRENESLNNGQQQPNHLPVSNEGFNTLTPLVTAAPKPPKNVETWNSIEGKGCFYDESTDNDDDIISIQSHQYALCLNSPTHVWIEMSATPPSNPLTDIGIYIFHMNEQEEPTQLITYTQHFINKSKWVCRLDLDGGNYIVLPYTPGCWLQVQEVEEGQLEDVPLIDEENGRIILTQSCIDVLKEIFVRHDLDNNGAISRSEFDFFHEKTNHELCDDGSWKVLQDNFDQNDSGELSLKGFLDLHEMTANDEDGGESELWSIIETMGYNKQLKLTKACPFLFEVFTQECDGEIEILPMVSSSVYVDHALCQLAKERGTIGTVKDGGKDVIAHILVTSHLTTIIIENKLSKKCLVQVDCSQCTDYYYNRDSAIHVLGIESNKMMIAYHLLPKDHYKPTQIAFVASLIKQ